MTDKKDKKYQYAFIGAGNMSRGIIGGMIANGVDAESIIASTRTVESGERLAADLGVVTTQDNQFCLQADVIVLAVKPQILTDVLKTLDSALLANKLILSVIAGVPCKVYQSMIADDIRLIRTMPNMPAKIGQGMTGMFALNCSEGEKLLADKLMSHIGKTLWVNKESGIDCVNAISGSGPAYVYGFIAHLAAAGEKLGLSYDDALQLTLYTVNGSSALAIKENDGDAQSMQSLINQITSKGGTTHEAMKSFEKDEFATIIDNAVQACHQRAKALGSLYD